MWHGNFFKKTVVETLSDVCFMYIYDVYDIYIYIYKYIYIYIVYVYVLIQVVYAVHKHTQLKMIGKQSYRNDCSS